MARRSCGVAGVAGVAGGAAGISVAIRSYGVVVATAVAMARSGRRLLAAVAVDGGSCMAAVA